jgi:peptidyl-dipeptidase Dcp
MPRPFPPFLNGLRYLVPCTAALILTTTFAAAPTQDVNQTPSSASNNPLFTESPLPFHYPQFDKIKDADFVPAIEAGMQEQLKEVDQIASDPEKPTFENTVVAMERTGRLLDRAERTFSNLNAADTNPTRQKIEMEMAPRLAAHRDAIHLNGKTWASTRNRPICWSATTRILCEPAPGCPSRTRPGSRR